MRNLLFMLFFTLSGLADAQQKSYPLVCQGDRLRFSLETDTRGVAGSMLVGSFEAAGTVGSAISGQCTWIDRAFRNKEPRSFCLRVNTSDLRAFGAQGVIRALSSKNGSARLLVYNNNAGCMVVTGIQALAFGTAHSTGVSVKDFRSRLQSVHATAHPSCGKCEDVTGPGTLPTPPQPSGIVASRLQAHNAALLALMRTLLSPDAFRTYPGIESGDCRNDIYCQIDLRRAAIAVGVGAP
jgi:hypothetical protein